MKRSMDREGCPKLFLLCVEYRTTVLLRGVSLSKVVGNHIVHKSIHQPSILQLCVEPQERFAKIVVEAGVSGVHRPECPAGDFSASVTKCDNLRYQNRILAGYFCLRTGPECPASTRRSVRPSRRLRCAPAGDSGRSEERRVGKECRL